MPSVTIELPSVLAPVVNGERSFTVDADTLPAALAALFEIQPGLKVHLYDETEARVVTTFNGELEQGCRVATGDATD